MLEIKNGTLNGVEHPATAADINLVVDAGEMLCIYAWSSDKRQAIVHCSNCDKGASTNKVCKVGCIGCMKCQKVCEVGAIKVENFHATVDPEKCVGCGKCVEACPRHCLAMLE